MKRIFGLLILLVIILSACGSEGRAGEIIFGLGSLEEGIEDRRSTFSQRADFLSEMHVAKEFGTNEIRLSVLKQSNDLESVYQEWYESVEPGWDYLLYEFHVDEYDEEYEPGDYIVRVYTDESRMVAEGFFSIE